MYKNEVDGRVPIGLYLGNEWVCEFMDVDYVRFHSDCRYQQESRLKCNEITEKELGYRFGPMIDFGVIQDASIYGGMPVCKDKAFPILTPAVAEPEEIDPLIEKMYKIDPLESGLVPRFFEWRDQIKRDYGADMKYGNATKGCATMMGQILGIINFLTWIITEPERIRRLIDCWYDIVVRYTEAMRKVTGFVSAGWFGIYSDLSGMISPSLYEEFIKEKEKKLYQRFAGGIDDKRYYHADYRMLHQLPHLRDIGVNQINVDPYIDCKAILDIMPDVVIFGQIPPTEVLLYGTPEQVRQCVKRDIEQAGRNHNLIVSTAGGVNPGTSIENLKAIYEATEEYGYIY